MTLRNPNELLDMIAAAWDAPPPTLDEKLRLDIEFGRYYKSVSGRSWNDLSLATGKLSADCWLLWLPRVAREYYFATYLAHPLKLEIQFQFVDRVSRGVDFSFFATCGLLSDDPQLSGFAGLRHSCIIEVACHILQCWDEFNVDDPVCWRRLMNKYERYLS